MSEPICVQAVRLHDAGMTYEEIAEELADYYTGRLASPTRGWVAGLLRTARRNQRPDPRNADQSAESTPSLSHGRAPKTSAETVKNVETYSFLGQDETPYKLPVFDGEPHIAGDCVVVGDVHLPTTDYTLADTMLRVAQRVGIRQLVICGDLLNMDAYSAYEHIVTPPPFELEIRAAKKMIAQWAQWFTTIWMVLGNHELRLLKRNSGRLTSDWLWHILTPARDVLHLSPYSQIVITSGREQWRATHQRNYSKVPGRVGDTLAQKYQMNIISAHQHHIAKRRDSYNRYTIIDNGGLFRDDMMAYVQLVDSTSNVMARGFTVLVNGTGHLITPYQSFTDLDILLAGLAAQRALAA